MPCLKASLEAEKADKYINTLAKHFAKKVTVHGEDDVRKIHFPMGTCQMSLANNTLSFFCEADEEDALFAVRNIMTSHITMLKEFKHMAIEWQPSE